MKRARTVLINLSVFLILLILLELFFGGWVFNKNNMNNINILRSQTLTYNVDGFYENNVKSIKYTRDDFGLRGSAPNQPDKIYILTVGGSTTDQRFINDGSTWQDVLEKDFSRMGKDIRVSNAGVDGQSTYGHIKNFDLWFPNIPGLQPKIILFYIGINDFYIDDNSSYDDVQSFTGKIKNYSVIYNLFRKIRGNIRAHTLKVAHLKVDFSTMKYTALPEISQNKYHDIMKLKNEEYGKRLEVLILKTRQMKAEPVFVTQPSRYYRFDSQHRLEGSEQPFKYGMYNGNGVDYYYMRKIQDSILLSTAGKYGVKCLDLAKEENLWEENDFYDFNHMTPKGAAKVGAYLFNNLKEYITALN